MPNSTSASTMMQARVIAAVFAISLPKSIPRKRQARIAAAKTFRPERTGRARRFLDFDYFNIHEKKNQLHTQKKLTSAAFLSRANIPTYSRIPSYKTNRQHTIKKRAQSNPFTLQKRGFA